MTVRGSQTERKTHSPLKGTIWPGIKPTSSYREAEVLTPVPLCSPLFRRYMWNPFRTTTNTVCKRNLPHTVSKAEKAWFVAISPTFCLWNRNSNFSCSSPQTQKIPSPKPASSNSFGCNRFDRKLMTRTSFSQSSLSYNTMQNNPNNFKVKTVFSSISVKVEARKKKNLTKAKEALDWRLHL